MRVWVSVGIYVFYIYLGLLFNLILMDKFEIDF